MRLAWKSRVSGCSKMHEEAACGAKPVSAALAHQPGDQFGLLLTARNDVVSARNPEPSAPTAQMPASSQPWQLTPAKAMVVPSRDHVGDAGYASSTTRWRPLPSMFIR